MLGDKNVSHLAGGRAVQQADVPELSEPVTSQPSPSLTAKVAALIGRAVLDGTYAPGVALREASLADRYVVSRRTVREALLHLNEQGLVTHRHHFGATVRVLTPDDIRDLYRVRRMLECEGLRSASSCDGALLARLRPAMSTLQVCIDEFGVRSVELAEADVALHGAIIALSGSPRIDDFYQRIGAQMTHAIAVLQRSGPDDPKEAAIIIDEHRAIVDAILDAHLLDAQRLILEHINQYEATLLGRIT
jgi:DNA-binding GntR family transcriptional regulator